jgi:integrase
MGISNTFPSLAVAGCCIQARAGVPTGYGNSDQATRGYVMPKISLTDRFCATAKPLAGVRTDFFDETIAGLALRVTESGHRTWTYHFTSPRDGKRARLTIGTYPATTLAGARGKAMDARGHVERGQDPRITLDGRGAAEMTVAGLVEAYLADPDKAARRSNAESARRLRKNVTPLIGAVRIVDVRRRDVRKVTDTIMHRGKPVEAARVFEDVRGMVRWAVEAEYLEVDPIAGMPKPGGGTTRERVLSDEEIATLWNGLGRALARSISCQRIIRLCLVTAQRVGEVAGISRAEVDWSAREWRLPGARTKNGHPHVVPLSDLAIEFLKEAFDDAGRSAFAFPCGEGALSPIAVARTILRANDTSEEPPLGRFGVAPWSAHDLRRTALTGMAQLGVAPIVLGHVANHRTTTRAGITLGVYNKYACDKEKRAALNLWADRVRAIVEGNGADVVPLLGGTAPS